ncbi:hypothetical protein GC722_10980 [Auraticoccus sp. F435]|uniref:Hyaluronate lyase n=1 Tax=Auraticoccus cholistanensis TaxID=2656650 RepID=A0A6A9UY03_9ACTN|nr:polysaccharide lyase 8 family protein [Auraticoccus cholistanensis]MVA76544.1 hypothetical protein [Auraticoccus cholistanensis]
MHPHDADSPTALPTSHPDTLRLTRRTLLVSTATASTAALTLTGPGTRAAAQDEYDSLRTRWADLLTGGELDPSVPEIRAGLDRMDAQTATLLDGLQTSADRTLLWQDLPVAGPQEANVGVSYQRLLDLALAWATTGSAVEGDEEVLAAVVSALRFLHDEGYNASMSPSGNWWFWEIGNPRRLADTCALLGPALPAEDLADYLAAIRRFTPNPNFRGRGTSPETGANRTDKAVACAVRGVLARDGDEIALARDALSDVVGGGRNSVFRYVTSGDGFYADGSFVQHGRLPYVGTYGNVALGGVAEMLALLGGSSWDVADPDRDVVLDAPEKSFAPFIWNGLMMETVRGRAVSRERERDFHDAASTISALLLMAPGVDEAHARRYRSLARGWIDAMPVPYLELVGLPEVSRALALLADASVVPGREVDGHQHFADQDRSVHRRPGWAFTVSTSSSRIGRYEWGNDENNLGWYQGDGMTYLYVEDDLRQFSDDFWPTVDPYRLPGTTVGLEPRQSGEGAGTGIPRATRPWAGGAVAAGRWGAIGMDHLAYDGDLTARKSWFCLDDSVVALGAQITSTDGFEVETCVENRLQRPGSRLLVDGDTLLDVDGETDLTGASWAHLEGVGGYLFGPGSRLVARREERTGSWRRINSGGDTGGSDTPTTRRYLQLRLEHGVDPAGAGYEYVLLPRATPAQTRRRASAPGHQVLANTADVQAVRAVQRGTLVTLANVFTAGEVDGHRSSGPCSLVLVRQGGQTTVAVSDPSRSAAPLRLELALPGDHEVVGADDELTVTTRRGRVQVDAALGRSRGATRTLTLRRV